MSDPVPPPAPGAGTPTAVNMKCPACRSEELEVVLDRESGQVVTILSPRTHCKGCGDEFYTFAQSMANSAAWRALGPHISQADLAAARASGYAAAMAEACKAVCFLCAGTGAGAIWSTTATRNPKSSTGQWEHLVVPPEQQRLHTACYCPASALHSLAAAREAGQ